MIDHLYSTLALFHSLWEVEIRCWALSHQFAVPGYPSVRLLESFWYPSMEQRMHLFLARPRKPSWNNFRRIFSHIAWCSHLKASLSPSAPWWMPLYQQARALTPRMIRPIEQLTWACIQEIDGVKWLARWARDLPACLAAARNAPRAAEWARRRPAEKPGLPLFPLQEFWGRSTERTASRAPCGN